MNRNAEKKTAFVAGATGYTGLETVKRLIEEGRGAVAHVRPDSPRLEEWRERFAELGAEVDATPWEIDAMAETLARLQPAAVFCLIGTTNSRKRRLKKAGGDPDRATHEAVDYGLTALLVEAARRAGGSLRFVYLSAVGTGPKARGSYMRARYKAEEAVCAAGLPYAVARPAFIHGEGREEPRRLESFAARSLDAALGVAGRVGLKKLEGRYGSISGPALARALVRLAFDPAFENRVAEPEELRALSL